MDKHEQKARKIADRHIHVHPDDPLPGLTQRCQDRLAEHIAQALREAEDEAYERAAKECDKRAKIYKIITASGGAARVLLRESAACATAIRALEGHTDV